MSDTSTTTENTSPKLRIVVGSDDAGSDYKKILKADLEKDDRVAEVIDVGVTGDENTAYPHVAVDAARKIIAGDADRARRPERDRLRHRRDGRRGRPRHLDHAPRHRRPVG